MIPLRDVIPSRTTPYVTIGLIVVNVLVFLYEMTLDDPYLERIRPLFGLVPAAFAWVAVLTSMFVHGGLLHVGGNMLFLWIFGDNVEDRMGHGRFLVFYLLCGAAAALAQTAMNPDSIRAMVGASGAVAGVMGAYFVLYPHSRIVTLVPIVLLLPRHGSSGARLSRVVVRAAVRQRRRLNRGGDRRRTGRRHRLLGARRRIRRRRRAGCWCSERPERQRVEWWNDVR